MQVGEHKQILLNKHTHNVNKSKGYIAVQIIDNER